MNVAMLIKEKQNRTCSLELFGFFQEKISARS